MKNKPIQIWGSLQQHRAMDSVDGGVCPCIGTTDFGLPRVLELEYEEVRPINPMEDGTARTIKAQYNKSGLANFFQGGSFGATGALEIYDTNSD